MKSFYKKIVVTNVNKSITLHLSDISIEQNNSSFTITQENMTPPHKFTLNSQEFTWKKEE